MRDIPREAGGGALVITVAFTWEYYTHVKKKFPTLHVNGILSTLSRRHICPYA